MKKLFYILKIAGLMALSLMSIPGCKRDMLNTPLEKNTGKPGVISNIGIKNESGQATLTYALPSDEDLLYVKAVYEIRPGVKREIVSSYYNNQLTVDGFGSAGEKEIKLYCVNRSETASDPVVVKVNPTKPPIELVYESLKIVPGFGGPNIKFTNDPKAAIIIVPLADTLNNGTWANLDKIYTQSAAGNLTIRGLQSKPIKFGFVVMDRFQNVTDTLIQKLTPYSEIRLDRSKFSPFPLPGDAELAYGTFVKYMWDGNYNQARWPCTFTVESAATPQTITIDLGVTKALSRLVLFPRTEDGTNFYVRGNLKDYEVWGTNNPSANGSYDNWMLLGSKTIVKPSGLPAGTESGEDLAYAQKGWEMEFEPGQPPYRYVRLKCLKNWQNAYFMMITQMEVYGSK
ncbi:DUF5000 domain-containing lipoprotein [Pedobacter sp. HMWF019]|uniref:DUF5000 domain-containing lipoprotein n=1 Tax=Pedobacter sp. HMWF019 TaxID=2056856 RepID=UPI001304FC6F|nr:DUF5000 domain-containing lipoprotein [Pedobacter sp. HMWF019]